MVAPGEHKPLPDDVIRVAQGAKRKGEKLPEVFYIDLDDLLRARVGEEARHQVHRAIAPWVGALAVGWAVLAMLLLATGCANPTAGDDSENMANSAKVEANIGLQPRAENVRVADEMRIGDDAERDLSKQNQILEATRLAQATRIEQLEQGVAQRDATIAKQSAGLDVAARHIEKLEQDAVGRDKWDLSGGGMWIVITAGIALGLSSLLNVGLLSFVKVVVTEIRAVGATKWSGAARSIARNVKTRTRRGVVRRLGGVIGDTVIKINKASAAKI